MKFTLIVYERNIVVSKNIPWRTINIFYSKRVHNIEEKKRRTYIVPWNFKKQYVVVDLIYICNDNILTKNDSAQRSISRVYFFFCHVNPEININKTRVCWNRVYSVILLVVFFCHVIKLIGKSKITSYTNLTKYATGNTRCYKKKTEDF